MINLKSINKLAIRAIVEFIALTSVLGVIGYGAYYKLDVTLKKSFEESVALQAKSIAVGLRNQFEEKFHRLEAASSLVSEGKIELDDIDEVFLVGSVGEEIGIINRNNESFRGQNF